MSEFDSIYIKNMTYFSEANCLSRSNCSKFGLSKSLIIGSNTANCNGGRGVSNWGGMIPNWSCFTPNSLYNLIDSGTRWLSIENKLLSNNS